MLNTENQNKLYNYFHAFIKNFCKKDKNKTKCKKHI
jgi:hypothetical protein